jgi:hypothetical protein
MQGTLPHSRPTHPPSFLPIRESVIGLRLSRKNIDSHPQIREWELCEFFLTPLPMTWEKVGEGEVREK